MTTSNQPLPIGERPPAFGCIVYIRRHPSGGVAARVANLPGLAVDAADERSAIRQLVPMFRQRVAAASEAGQPSPLIEPPEPIGPGEVKRFLPVHL